MGKAMDIAACISELTLKVVLSPLRVIVGVPPLENAVKGALTGASAVFATPTAAVDIVTDNYESDRLRLANLPIDERDKYRENTAGGYDSQTGKYQMVTERAEPVGAHSTLEKLAWIGGMVLAASAAVDVAAHHPYLLGAAQAASLSVEALRWRGRKASNYVLDEALNERIEDAREINQVK